MKPRLIFSITSPKAMLPNTVPPYFGPKTSVLFAIIKKLWLQQTSFSYDLTWDKRIKTRKVEVYHVHPHKKSSSSKVAGEVQSAYNYSQNSLHPTQDDLVRYSVKGKAIRHPGSPLNDTRHWSNVVGYEAVRINESQPKSFVVGGHSIDNNSDGSSCEKQ